MPGWLGACCGASSKESRGQNSSSAPRTSRVAQSIRGKPAQKTESASSGDISFDDLKRLSLANPKASDFLFKLKNLGKVDGGIVDSVGFTDVIRNGRSGHKRWGDLKTLYGKIKAQTEPKVPAVPRRTAVASKALNPISEVTGMSKSIHKEMSRALSTEYQSFADELQTCMSSASVISLQDIEKNYPTLFSRIAVICDDSEAPMKRIVSSLIQIRKLDTSSASGAFWDAYSNDSVSEPEQIACTDSNQVQACITEQLEYDLKKAESNDEVQLFIDACNTQDPSNDNVHEFISNNAGVLEVKHNPEAQKSLARLVVQGNFSPFTTHLFIDDIPDNIWKTGIKCGHLMPIK